MAQRFNLTAQLQLQANSSNINQVVSQLKKQLAPLGNVQLNVQANTKSLAQANQQMATFNANAKTASGSVGEFNRSLAESARRFSVITVATGSLLSLVNAFKKSTSAAIDFEYEMVKISQTTGQTMREVGAMSNEIRKLSTSLGVSSAELAGTARILLQAGLSADKTRKSLDILAKTTLSASFDDLQSTTEGAIALINQFRGEAARAGGDVKFLEQSLDSINAVSKAFAVESADLVDVIRKVGGVFSNAGGSVNELISLFTSVRATTRESAETIGTGLRTIFTRIQRGDTVDALKELGIELRNSQGQFVGAFEAVKRLSEGLSALDPRDFRFAAVVEELGGYRQIGKVIPLINQFTIAQQALNIAQSASGSVAADAQTSQQALAVQINKTKEKFNEFIANLVGSDSFRSIITGALKLADAFINIGKALEPVLPLLTTLFALKAGQGLASGIGILRGFAGAPSGIRASKFASGGLVPGSGNRDTVPAMLTPGEFVIRKSSVNKLGAATLAQMNANGYAKGGQVLFANDGIKVTSTVGKTKGLTIDQAIAAGHKKAAITSAFGKEASDAAFAQRANQQKISTEKEELKDAKQEKTSSKKQVKFKVLPGQIGGFILNPTKGDDGNFVPTDQLLKKEFVLNDGTPAVLDSSAGYPTFYPGGRGVEGKTLKTAAYSRILDAGSKLGLKAGIENAVDLVKNAKLLDVKPAIDTDENLMRRVSSGLLKDQQVISTVSGYLFEGMIGALSGAIPAGGRAGFDFPRSSIEPNKPKLKSLFDNTGVQNLVKAEAKRNKSQFTGSDGVINKTINDIRKEWASTKGNGPFEGVQKLNKGSSGTGVKPSNYPLVDDILENAKGAILPNPKNIEDIIKAGGGALDVDRTLIRTIGDKAYAQAKTEKAKEEVLKKYFVGAGRLQDIKSSPLTQFGKTLQSAIQSGQINPNNLKIITKSRRVDGVGEYLNQLFGIPLANMIFTQGGSKQPALDAFNTKGSRAQRVVKRASGGGISGSDTVPAMLTPGEFVVSKSAAQSIGYTNLNRMNKHGVTGYASGGVVGFKKFAAGGPTGKGMGLSTVNVGTLDVVMQALAKIGVTSGKTAESTERYNKAIEAASLALSGGASDAEGFDIAFEKLRKSSQDAKDAVEQETKAKDAARKSPTSGDTVAMDERLKSSQNLGGGAPTKSFGQAAMINPVVAKQLEEQQKKEIQAIAKEIRSIDANVTAKDALLRAQNVVKNEYGILASELNKEKQSLTQSQAQRAKLSSIPKYSGVGLGDKDSRAGFAQRGGEIAGSMQNFAFLGASVAAVTSQLGLFGDTTNKAIAETAGFTVGLVGIVGTLAQTLTSFGANSLAVQANTGSITQNTAAQKGAAAANALGLVVIAAVAAVSALKFLSSQNKESAEAINKDRDARLKSAAETGVSNFKPGELQAGLEQELEMRQRSAEQMSASSLKTVASFTAVGAGVGFLLGGPFGAAIGGAIGAAAGLGTALLDSESAVMEAAEARRREVEAIGKVYESYLQLSASSYKLSSTLNAIESTPGLSNQDKLERRMEAIATSSAGNDALRAGTLASNQLKTSAGRLGVTTAAASAMSPEEITAAAKKNNPDLGEGDIADIQASIKASVATLKASADETARQIQETGKNLNDAAANLDLSGTTNAAQKTVAAYNQAIEAYIQSIERERDFKLSQVNSQDKTATDAVKAEAEIKISAARAGKDATIKAKIAEAEANKRAVAAQIAMAEAARRTAVFLDSLADEKDTIKARSEALKDFTDSLSGGIVDLSTAIKPIRNIEDPSKITDAAKFSRQVQGVAQVSGSPEAQKAADELTNVAKLFEQANRSLIGKTFELEESIDAEKILKDIGLTPEALGGGDLGKAIFQQIAVTLRDQKTPITPEILDKILAPLAERAKDSASIINEIQSVQQEEINLRQQQIQAEQMLRDEQLSAISKYNSAVSSGSEALARATGQSVAAVRARNERESRQRTLNETARFRGGRFLDATDPAQLAREKKAAQARTIEIINEIARLKQLGNTVKDLDGQLSKLQAEQAQLANVTKDASAALEEIASSSAEIDRLTEALDKERQVREQAFSVLKEFVVGGEDARSAITSGAMGVLSAIQTGTTQNLSEEQRSQTFGLLDKLKDVMIAGTGLTGGQIANELVFRDAVRLGFPPDIAKELATQSTTEELILKELQIQTKLQAVAAKVPASNLNTQAGTLGFSSGGVVYRADGGSIFQSKGTDTVPAMLTPGEYVVNARSAAKNMSLLKTINASKGGSVRYRAKGSDDKEMRNYFESLPFTDYYTPYAENIQDMEAQKTGAFTKKVTSAELLGGENRVKLEAFKESITSRKSNLENELTQLAPSGGVRYRSPREQKYDFDLKRIEKEKEFLQLRSKISSNKNLRKLNKFSKGISVKEDFDYSSIKTGLLLDNPKSLEKWYVENLQPFTKVDYKNYIPPDTRKNQVDISFLRSQLERERVKELKETVVKNKVRAAAAGTFLGGSGNINNPLPILTAAKQTLGIDGPDFFENEFFDPKDREAYQLYEDMKYLQRAQKSFEDAYKQEQDIFNTARKQENAQKLGMLNAGKTNIDPNIVGKATNPNSTLAAAQAGAFIVTQSKIMATEENIANKKLLEDMKKEEAGIAASGGDSMLYRLSKQMNGTSTDKYVQEAIDARKEKIQEQNAKTATASELISKSKTLKDAIQAVDKGFYDYILNFTDVGAKTADGKSIAQEVKNLTSKWQQQALDGGLAKLVSDIYTSSRGKDKVDILFLDPSNFKGASGRLNADSFRLAQNVARLYNSSRPSDDLAPLNEPENRASGGLVYRAGGGTIFKPRGTDTVPAMLTPGEFVVRKSAVDKIGVSNLAAINNGNVSTVNKAMGGPIYRAAGGPVAPIGAATATTTGAGPLGGINLISGASYTSMMQRGIAALAQSGQLTKFAKDLNSSDKDIKDLIFLIRSGKFQPNRFLATEIKTVADFMNNMNSGAAAIFSEINASGSMLNSNATVEEVENWITKSLGDIATLKAYKKIQYPGWGLLTEAALGTKGPIDSWEEVIGSVTSYIKTVTIPPGKTKADTAVGFGADVSTTAQINARDAGMGLSTKERDAIERLRASGFYLSGGGLVYMQSGGRAKYFNEGGNPADTIPAMLTPGEFVMSPEAVNKFGVGYMKSLNKGQVPGFRRGGLVGGGVAYRANGGSVDGGGGALSIDSSNLQGILTNFSDTFKANLDNMITALSTVGGAINSLASVFSAGMTINHQFTGDMTLAFNIQNGDALKTQIAEAITPKLAEIITRELDARLDNKNFKSGGS